MSGAKVIGVLAVIALLVLPASAQAGARAIAPPGNSAVNQYLETVPTAQGGRPATGVQGSGATPARAGVLTPATQRALARLGVAGRAVTTLVADAAPTNQSSADRSRGGPGGGGAGAPASRSGRSSSSAGGTSPLPALTQSVTGTGPVGSSRLLPVTLVLIALGGAGLAFRRGRRRP